MALKGISDALLFFILVVVSAAYTTSLAVAQEIDRAPAPAPTMEANGYRAISGAFAFFSLFLSFIALLWQ